MLRDPLMAKATREILPEGKDRPQIQREIKEKERAIDMLGKKYSNAHISRDKIMWCIYSINDNHSFLTANRLPVDQMIEHLKKNYSPDKVEDG